MKKIIIITLIASLGTSFGLNAQTPGDEVIKSQFIKDRERAQAYTIDYLNIMPADQYSFKATDSIRSFARQILHLAQGNVNIMALVTGEPNIIGDRIPEDSNTEQTKDSVMYYIVASYDLAINGLKKMNTASFNENVKLYNWAETKYVWVLKAFGHQTHHRGQTTIYIRLPGLHPPQERLF